MDDRTKGACTRIEIKIAPKPGFAKMVEEANQLQMIIDGNPDFKLKFTQRFINFINHIGKIRAGDMHTDSTVVAG